MDTRLIVILFFTCTSYLNAQNSLISLEQLGLYIESKQTFSHVTDIRDLNNSLNSFDGSWSGTTTNGLELTIFTTNSTVTFATDASIEVLLFDLKIVDSSGVILMDTRNLSSSINPMRGRYITSSGEYRGSWGYTNSNIPECGITGEFIMDIIPPTASNTDVLRIMLWEDYMTDIGQCGSNGLPVHYLPMETIINLTRI